MSKSNNKQKESKKKPIKKLTKKLLAIVGAAQNIYMSGERRIAISSIAMNKSKGKGYLSMLNSVLSPGKLSITTGSKKKKKNK